MNYQWTIPLIPSGAACQNMLESACSTVAETGTTSTIWPSLPSWRILLYYLSMIHRLPVGQLSRIMVCQKSLSLMWHSNQVCLERYTTSIGHVQVSVLLAALFTAPLTSKHNCLQVCIIFSCCLVRFVQLNIYIYICIYSYTIIISIDLWFKWALSCIISSYRAKLCIW